MSEQDWSARAWDLYEQGFRPRDTEDGQLWFMTDHLDQLAEELFEVYWFDELNQQDKAEVRHVAQLAHWLEQTRGPGAN